MPTDKITEAMVEAGNRAFDQEMRRDGMPDDNRMVRDIYTAMEAARPIQAETLDPPEPNSAAVLMGEAAIVRLEALAKQNASQASRIEQLTLECGRMRKALEYYAGIGKAVKTLWDDGKRALAALANHSRTGGER